MELINYSLMMKNEGLGSQMMAKKNGLYRNESAIPMQSRSSTHLGAVNLNALVVN